MDYDKTRAELESTRHIQTVSARLTEVEHIKVATLIDIAESLRELTLEPAIVTTLETDDDDLDDGLTPAPAALVLEVGAWVVPADEGITAEPRRVVRTGESEGSTWLVYEWHDYDEDTHHESTKLWAADYVVVPAPVEDEPGEGIEEREAATEAALDADFDAPDELKVAKGSKGKAPKSSKAK